MENTSYRIIYLSAKEKAQGGWPRLLSRTCPVEKTECQWLGYSIRHYVIEGRPPREQETQRGGIRFYEPLIEAAKKSQWRRTLESIGARTIRDGWDDAEVFADWQKRQFPEEMAFRFFSEMLEKTGQGRPEQLILIGPQGSGDDKLCSQDSAVSLAHRLYQDYNYMTILTGREQDFADVAEEAAQESGLYIRCLEMAGDILFPDKRTAVLDLSESLPACYRHFPKGTAYVALTGCKEKRRRITAKCPGAAYDSLRNHLDTVLHNTV